LDAIGFGKLNEKDHVPFGAVVAVLGAASLKVPEPKITACAALAAVLIESIANTSPSFLMVIPVAAIRFIALPLKVK
jgi:hypothetical protein